MAEENFNYNFVVLGSGDYFLAGYHDIMKLPNVCYVRDCLHGINNPIDKLLVKINFSEKVNHYLKTPFSNYVYPRILPTRFDNSKPICYLFFINWFYLYNSSFIDYVKKKDPRTKFVAYFQDLIPSNGRVDIEYLKSKMDLILSYDRGESEKHGMIFHPTPMSRIEDTNLPPQLPSDFYFCGRAKTRYNTIIKLYKELKKNGFTCDFNIVDLMPGQNKVEGIKYLSSPMDYFANLSHVKSTKCVVEIMQEGADGYTPRFWESILYDKHLLTNNTSTLRSELYNNHFIHLSTDLDNDEVSNWINSEVHYDNELKNIMSPIRLLQFIDNLLIEQ